MNTFCGYFNQKTCHSCTLIESSYPSQIKQKEDLLLQKLTPFGKFEFIPSFTSPPIAFRSKAKMVVTGTIEKPIIGLSGQVQLDQGREILSCPLHHTKINHVIEALPEFITLCRLEPYQIKVKRGELKGVILFYSENSQEMYLRFVLRSKEAIDRIKKNLSHLQNQFPFLLCLSANIQPIAHAILEGKEEVFFTEKKYISQRSDSFSWSVSPQGFIQTNEMVSEGLYGTAAKWIKQVSPQKFTELFCGQGAFSFYSSPYVKESLGIEINPEAVHEANQTARRLGLHHLIFKCADAGEVLDTLNTFSPDLVLVNPPRKGLGKSLDILLKTSPGWVIYSSCSHETLALDLETLHSVYDIKKVQIFDMFPHTWHFETLVLLKKR